MSHAATADRTARASRRDDDRRHARAEPRSFDAFDNAWRRNLKVGAEAVRAFQAEHADFAGRLLHMNLEAARAFGSTATREHTTINPFELGASAVELYLRYLGRSAALAQQAIVLPWKDLERAPE